MAILAAAEARISASGLEQVTVGTVCVDARVSRSTFYRAFADREDCLLAVFDDIVDRLSVDVAAAYAGEECWVDGLRSVLLAILDFLQENPGRARFLITAGTTGDPAMLARRRRLLGELARSFDAYCPPSPQGVAGAPFGAEALIAAATSIIQARLYEDPFPPLRELCGSLMAVMVMPSLGERAAHRELTRPLPARPARPSI